MNKFTIGTNEYLSYNVQGFYHTNYTRYKNPGNPDYLNDLKNTFNDYSMDKLNSATNQLHNVLKNDLVHFERNLTICIVPRSKAENTYAQNQILFKKTIQKVIGELGFRDGSNYIIRHTDTKTTHLAHSQRGSQYAGSGDLPYPGITQKTCRISNDVRSKNILLIDDIYTNGINIDEDVIQSLYDKGANSVIFYSVGKTI
ncbi:MAG: amidophosphoribosyltransferase [Sulfurimonas sp.]|nr:MAG: amidophosphoribosyltransferase [Sulfurimonas sp.]